MLPSTRLETLVFPVRDLDEYVAIQKGRGVRFLTHEIQAVDRYRFIQTYPSPYTGNSLGFIGREKGVRGIYRPRNAAPLEGLPKKPDQGYLKRIGHLDHAATRVRAEDRDQAILEFLSLTGYHYQFAIPVESQNSLTSVTRRDREDFAMVFTSGIRPFRDEETSGPTETFIHRYGPRVHHLAFHTGEIRDTIAALGQDGVAFLDDLVGSEEEGIHQIFTRPSPHTMLVTEYIHRYGEFDGFFTESNVIRLTAATARQD
jgi:4-hydroxyphenylpyruvate dioxygenase-like putative hemolysin